MSVETRRVSRPSDADRDADRRTSSPRRPRPSTASPTVSAVVHTERSRPVDLDRELAPVPDDDLAGPRDRLVHGGGDEVALAHLDLRAGEHVADRAPERLDLDRRAVDVDRDRLVQDRERAGRRGDDGEHGRLGHHARGTSTTESATLGRTLLVGPHAVGPLDTQDASVLDAGPTVTDP